MEKNEERKPVSLSGKMYCIETLSEDENYLLNRYY